jgi:hypothetical protein
VIVFDSLNSDEEEIHDELEEAIGITHPVKINAKKGIARLMS